MNKSILIIGKIPPPLGGVTIHVFRLLIHLRMKKLNVRFYDISQFRLLTFIKEINQNSICHIHSSNPYFRLLLVIILILSNTKSILTIHGNLGRFNNVKNYVDLLAIKFCSVPILLNTESLKCAIGLNNNSRLISSFLPPVEDEPLSDQLNCEVDKFINNKENVYCTNAFDLSFDKQGKEIYGISELIKCFSDLQKFSLIFSDPSGNYSSYFRSTNFEISQNVMIISHPHNFVEIIKKSCGVIRSTTTDGDSITIQEGLFFFKRVICSDCVERPRGCEVYKTGDWEDFMNVLKSPNKPEKQNDFCGIQKLFKLYMDLLAVKT